MPMSNPQCLQRLPRAAAVGSTSGALDRHGFASQRASRLTRRQALAALMLGCGAAASAQVAPLRIGVLPTLGVGLLLSNYQPLREFLARELNRPIEMFTSKDIPGFHRDTLDGRYDVVVSAAHLVRLVQRDAGWTPVATYAAENHPVLLVSRNAPLDSVRHLAGRQVAVNNRGALVVMVAVQWLADQGLNAGRDYELVELANFSSAVQALQRDEVALAIVADLSLKQVPAAVLEGVRVLRKLPAVPTLVWAVSPRLKTDSAAIRAALLAFTPAQAQGEAFYKATGFGGMRGVSDDMLRALDPYADRARALLQARP